jgi:hypothetical protein
VNSGRAADIVKGSRGLGLAENDNIDERVYSIEFLVWEKASAVLYEYVD